MLDLNNIPNGIKLEINKEDLMAFANHLIGEKKQMENDEKIISLKDVMQLTGLARQTIYGRVSRGTIPYYKAEDGKRLRFKKSEILEWMQSGKKYSKNKVEQAIDAYFEKGKAKRR